MSDFDTDPKEVTSYVRDRMKGGIPPDFVGGVMNQVSRTPQRRQGWIRWQLLTGFAAAAAAVVVVGIGLSLLNGDDVGNEPTPTATTSPSPGTSPSAVPSGPISLPSLTPAIGCLDSPPDVEVLSGLTDPVACLGNAPLTFDARRIGAVVDCPVIEPTWLSCPQTDLILVDETRKVGAPSLLVAIDPASGVSLLVDTNVRVTGHFDDPAAQTCHEVERDPSVGGTPEPAAVSIEGCRRSFVVTGVVALEP